MIFRIFLIFCFVCTSVLASMAQQTETYSEPEYTYQVATELFEKEQYGSASELFDQLLNRPGDDRSTMHMQAAFYRALCAVELYHGDAAFRLDQFVEKYPDFTGINRVHFKKGELSYRDRKYRDAIESFEQVDVSELTAAERPAFYFKSGYSYLKRKDPEKANQVFSKVVNTSSKYASPAAYYLAHAAYEQQEYSLALDRFQALIDDPNFQTIAPYYIVQIHFLLGDHQQVVEMAPPLIPNATESRAAELNRILGESYYYLKKFDKALPFLSSYTENTRYSPSSSDWFRLGYCYFQDQAYKEASKNFQKATGGRDSLAQYAYYYLAASYLKLDQKNFAANAFHSAYKLPFDREIKEDALFNQAQLAFDMSFDPYNEAVRSLRNYLKAYPESERADEAYDFLYRISMTTRNFKEAQEALENIKVKNYDYKARFQKITYYQAIDLFNQYNYEEAVNLFKKATEFDQDKSIAAESYFWIAEAFYRQQNYWGAKKYYLDYLSKKEAKKQAVYNIANYNLGYVYFKREEYKGAIYYFKAFIDNLKDENEVMISDAFLRLGDSWFINKGYDNAISYYNRAIKMNGLDVDYALFQKSKALGVLQRYPEKINKLQEIINRFPTTPFLGEVYYELGQTYLVQQNNEKALLNFKKVASDFPTNSFAVKARLKSGLIYYNSNLNDLAIKTFKGVVEDYPGTIQAKEALSSLRNIYVEQGKVNEYFTYAENLSFADISVSEQDSITYFSAENQYMNGEYAKALGSLQQYVDQFENGAFKLSARFFLAECQFSEGDKTAALVNYNYVIEQPTSEFTETSLSKAASINYENGELEEALSLFAKLQAVAEIKTNIQQSIYYQLLINYELQQWEKVVVFADQYLESGKMNEKEKLEAMLMKANALMQSDDLLLAKSQFREIASLSQGAAGAESQYRISEINFGMGDIQKAEEEVFVLINNFGSYDYWIASGFILLADIYLAQDNIFQAKHTLQSILDNYEGEELKQVAQSKMDAILKAEAAANVYVTDSVSIDGEIPDENQVELEEY